MRKRGHGTTQTTVSRWESGQVPHASMLPSLAAELGCTVDELFDDDDEEAASMRRFDHDSILDVLIGALQAAKYVSGSA